MRGGGDAPPSRIQPSRAAKTAPLPSPSFPRPLNARSHPIDKSVSVLIGTSREEGAAEGLFASRPIASHEFVAWYRGLQLPLAAAEDPRYTLDYVWADPLRGLAIDAAHPDSCAGRYANDGFSQESNAKIVWKTRYTSPCLVATRPISQYEEILVEYGSSYWNAAHLSRLPVSAAARCRSYSRLPSVPAEEPMAPDFSAPGLARVRFSLYEFQGWEGVDASGMLRLVLGPTEIPRAWEHASTSAELPQCISTLFREPGGPCRFQLRYRPLDLSSLANVCKGDGSCAYQTLYLQSLRAGWDQGDRDRYAHGQGAPHLDYTQLSDRLPLITFLDDTLHRLPHLVTHVAVRVQACIAFLRTYTAGRTLAFCHWLTVTEAQMLTDPSQVSSLFEMHPGQEAYTLVSHSANRNREEVFPLSGIHQAVTNRTWSGLRNGHFQPLESSLSLETALEEAIADLVHRVWPPFLKVGHHPCQRTPDLYGST